jgi:hypothetical protein
MNAFSDLSIFDIIVDMEGKIIKANYLQDTDCMQKGPISLTEHFRFYQETQFGQKKFTIVAESPNQQMVELQFVYLPEDNCYGVFIHKSVVLEYVSNKISETLKCIETSCEALSYIEETLSEGSTEGSVLSKGSIFSGDFEPDMMEFVESINNNVKTVRELINTFSG